MVESPDKMSPRYAGWLNELDDFVRDITRFNVGRQDCDLRADYEVIGTAVTNTTSQFHIQTALWQLAGALRMQEAGAPPSAVPVLVRAALEAASAVAWFLTPEDVNTRVQRTVQLALQDSYDQFRFERQTGRDGYNTRRNELLQAGQRAGFTRACFESSRYNVTSALEDLDERFGESDLVSLWALLSGLAHGRPWAILAASGTDASGEGRVQMYVPREAFGYYQLRAAEVLDHAIGLWNQRVGSVGTPKQAPRLPRTDEGRAPGLPAPPWTWSPS
ncbi:hypothetical protein [Microbacterium sp. B35-04]|uniref:hypothetical protein n=1 Tax=Microbacterium sp. B35-04 TaxID=1961716 RepID=UPI0013D511EE|nr:hypothetical protein [Microbacterium sp. B35-04]